MKLKIYNKLLVNRISWKFLICVLGTILLCGFSTFQGSFPEVNEISFYAWLHYSREELLLMGEQASAFYVMVTFRDMEWFIVFLPLLAAFSTATDFAGQWFSGYYYSSISRKTRKKYAVEWMLRAALQGASCIICGILIYFMLAYCKFPHYGEFGVDADSSIIAMTYGATALKRFVTLFLMVFHTGLLAAIFAMSSVLLTILCKDSFFAVSSLVLMEYFSSKLYAGYEEGLIKQYYMQGQEVPMFNSILRFFFPSNHLYYDQSFSIEYGIGYWFYLIFAGLLIVGIWLWFYKCSREHG
ncbi:hypothetical protein AALA36_15775 [Lachnospiraceae bacterium 66-29]